MQTRRQTIRFLIPALAATLTTLALAASAAAVVYVYNNNFSSVGEFRELDGGGRGCEERYRSKSNAMLVRVERKRLCGYLPPVVADSSQPDHEIFANGTILKKRTPRNVRRNAYLAVRVRVGGGDYYEFQVRPKGRKFKLTRSPGAGGLPQNGESGAIKGLNRPNKLRLRVTGDQVDAFVNGQSVASFTDPSPGQVDGRRVSFGLGSNRDRREGPAAIFERVRVGIPNP